MFLRVKSIHGRSMAVSFVNESKEVVKPEESKEHAVALAMALAKNLPFATYVDLLGVMEELRVIYLKEDRDLKDNERLAEYGEIVKKYQV